jgi:carbonic anhydrase/acetyltransferase-like protein (isoleucine patch superfamily)
MDKMGIALEGDAACIEKLPIPTTAVKVGGKAPSIGEASFVAPSANLLGAVTLASGASAWYGALLKGDTQPVTVGKLSSVGDNASVVGCTVGESVSIGAGSVVKFSTLADESSVGLGCTVGKGCTLGKGAMLAAASVLPPGTKVPAGQVWAGAPAKQVGTPTAAEAAGVVATASLTADLGTIHMEEAWKDLMLVDQEHADQKRQRQRTIEIIEQMREDPGWVPLPTLGEWLTKHEVRERSYALK